MLSFSVVTLLLALIAVSSGAVMTSHSSTEHPLESTTRTSTTSYVSTSTKNSVTEELENTHVLGIHDDDDDDDDDDDSGENDAPLPTLPPTDLVPPDSDAELIDWTPQTQRPPVGLLVVRIIQIIRPTERPEKLINTNNQNFMAPKENIYTPNYPSVMAGSEDNYSQDEQAFQKMHLMQLLRARLDSMQQPLFASRPFQTPWYRSFNPSFVPSRFNAFPDFNSNA